MREVFQPHTQALLTAGFRPDERRSVRLGPECPNQIDVSFEQPKRRGSRRRFEGRGQKKARPRRFALPLSEAGKRMVAVEDETAGPKR
jgi:hypothetical protein